jgi:hypothetical protein
MAERTVYRTGADPPRRKKFAGRLGLFPQTSGLYSFPMPNQSPDICRMEATVDPRLPSNSGNRGESREDAGWMILPEEVVPLQQNACAGLEPAFEQSDTDTASDWVLRCQLDLAQLWHCGELWAVTQVVRGKRGLVLQIVGMAGRYDPALLNAIESWGRGIGCLRVYFTGRQGWLRREPDYKMSTVTAFKDL